MIIIKKAEDEGRKGVVYFSEMCENKVKGLAKMGTVEIVKVKADDREWEAIAVVMEGS